MPTWVAVFARFLRLGITAFGGPVAHLGYFRDEFVARAGWLDDEEFAELVALCSVLPGPTSSQVGIAIGLRRAGWPGACAAWLAFTTPSALLLALAGSTLRGLHGGDRGLPGTLMGALAGLFGVAAAIVALAVVALARRLAVTALARATAVAALVVAIALEHTGTYLQWLPLLAGGLLAAAFGPAANAPGGPPSLRVSARTGALAGAVFVALLVGLPIVAVPGSALALFATFFRAGSLVFGGGHVVLPFLRSVASPSTVPIPEFFAGYGLAQAVPGPLFTFAAFLGADDRAIPSAALGALLATLGIFAPSFLLIATALPLWHALRKLPRAGALLAGFGAAVVGLLAAVFVDPILVTLVRDPLASALALAALVALAPGRIPVWLVVLAAAAVGAAVHH